VSGEDDGFEASSGVAMASIETEKWCS
jgi:hypothetical protein